MRRHWQHTSFCMGQCVSSCGSKRTLDSVPTTPDTENYPGLVPIAKIIHRQNSKRNLSAIGGQDSPTFHHKPKSSAVKFVTAFSQRRIATSRINPEGESPARLRKSSGSPAALSFNITTAPSSDFPTLVHHGDMREPKSKNYFRETISSAKKSSSKSVTFSETSPSPGTVSRKKSFFSFHKKSSKQKNTEELDKLEESTSSQGLSKLFLSKKSKEKCTSKVPTVVRPLKEKQVCRVTLSPKHGSTCTTLVRIELRESRRKESDNFEQIQNNDEFADENNSQNPPVCGYQEMGNASSSSQGLVVEAVKTIKPIVHSNKIFSTNVDFNENSTTGKSVASESPGLTRKDSKTRRLPLSKNNDLENISRNLNSIKEENRLLRLKFFAQDSDNCNAVAAINTGSTCVDSVTKMNRQNMTSKHSLLPKPSGGKLTSVTSGIPKLYSVPIAENDGVQKSTTTSSRMKLNQKGEAVQPSNLKNGQWLPAEEFFPPSDAQEKPNTSPSTGKSSRRSSEPTRYTPPGTSLHIRSIRGTTKCSELTAVRRDTFGYNQQRKLPISQANAGVLKLSGSALTTDKNAPVSRPIPSKTGVRKPEATKPFYTMGLYQPGGKTGETGKTFGIHKSGFSGVSTGVVQQRLHQFQSKVPTTETSQVPRLQSTHKITEKRKEDTCHIGGETVSPRKTGVVRSATYTIRKHGFFEDKSPGEVGGRIMGKSKTEFVDKYSTYTKKKSLGKERSPLSVEHTAHNEANDEDHSFEGSLCSQSGYPLQHNVSGTSTSSMGTNEDGIGDHVVISDSEYLIDDEISDQPELTLTFKDSSLKLSASSSGESLISDIMLDHLDINQDRILGELTSDSAISDISSHKPKSKSSTEQLHRLSESTKSRSFDQPCSKILENSQSPCDMASPSSVRTVRYLKSPRRISRPAVSTSQLQTSLDSNSSRSLCNSFINTRTPSASSLTTPKPRTSTPDKKQVPGRSPIQVKSSLQSPTTSSMSPRNRKPSAKENVALTVENVNKLHKQYQLADSLYNPSDEKSLPGPFADDILPVIHDLREQLVKLQIQLETQEQRERKKDELIARLSSENDRLKTIVKGDMELSFNDKESDLISPKSDGGGSPSNKEKYLDSSRNYENAAVQTENNNIFNRSVTYPEDDDKYGELVSFRIGRSSSLKKKL